MQREPLTIVRACYNAQGFRYGGDMHRFSINGMWAAHCRNDDREYFYVDVGSRIIAAVGVNYRWIFKTGSSYSSRTYEWLVEPTDAEYMKFLLAAS